MKHQILYLDDNSNNLVLVQEILAYDYEIFCTDSIANALKILENEQIKVIIADYLMPEMNGIDFLISIKNKYPYSIKIILTAIAYDINIVTQAFKDAEVYHYITKPIVESKLKLTIKNAVEVYELKREKLQLTDNLKYKNQQLEFEIEDRKRLEQQTIQTILDVEQRERSHFAKEMHDSIGPQLSIINLYLSDLLNYDSSEKCKVVIEKTIRILEHTINSVVEISHAMSPHILQNYGISHAIESFCKKIEFDNSPEFHLSLSIEERIAEICEFTLYRVATELINNTLKYAKATTVFIYLSKTDEKINFIYRDNGIGFDINNIREKNNGMGLSNIKNRIETLKGSISIKSQVGKGMSVEITL